MPEEMGIEGEAKSSIWVWIVIVLVIALIAYFIIARGGKGHKDKYAAAAVPECTIKLPQDEKLVSVGSSKGSLQVTVRSADGESFRSYGYNEECERVTVTVIRETDDE